MTPRRIALCTALALALAACSGSSNSDVGSPSGSTNKGGGTTNDADNPSSGSSGDSADHEALFTAGGDATPDSIFGVWGGTLEEAGLRFDSRMKLDASSVTFATRCNAGSETSAVVGVTVRARVSASEVAVLESDQNSVPFRNDSCRAQARVSTFKACTSEQMASNCFLLDGLELHFYGTNQFDKTTLTKISD